MQVKGRFTCIVGVGSQGNLHGRAWRRRPYDPPVSFWEQVELHEARGLPRHLAIDAARIHGARVFLHRLEERRAPQRRWDEALHPRDRRGQFRDVLDMDENGNPVEPDPGGGFVGSRMPAMTPKQVEKMLKKAGFQRTGQKGSHAVFQREGARKVVVPMHGNRAIPRGTLMSIMSKATQTA